MTVLGIGLDSGMSESLSNLKIKGFETIRTENFAEAEDILDNTDLAAIMVDSRASPKIREDINALLAETPLTTTIVLVVHPSDMISTETFQALGVKTIGSPASADDLAQLLS